MTVEQITGLKVGSDSNYKVVEALKKRSWPETDIQKIFDELDIERHDVMNPEKRKNKPVYGKETKLEQTKTAPGAKPADAATPKIIRWVEANRINAAFQELICKKRVSFCLANPVIRSYNGIDDEAQQLVLSNYLDKVYFDNKTKTHDREIALNIFKYTEVAEYWYPKMEVVNHKRYGFETKMKLKVRIFSREKGDKFYPLKDKDEDFICFGREYNRTESGKAVTFFEAYTDEQIVRFKHFAGNGWSLISNEPHTLKKIPIVYGWQRYPEYRNAQSAISRLETLLSNHGEINDYHSAPKIILNNAQNITGFGEKGEAGMILQAKGDADAKYLTWDHSTQSVKDEIENLFVLIYSLTQTPNINFDNLKDMGAVSGVAIKLLFMDAHLAVKDKEGILLDFFQRRNSIVMAYGSEVEPKLKPIVEKAEVTTELVPFMIADEKEQAEILQIQNGNQAVVSQETSVIKTGYDKEEFERLTKEESARKLIDVSEPTI